MQAERSRITRRSLLSGVAGGAGMLALAACGTATVMPTEGEAPAEEESKAEEAPKAMEPTVVNALMVLEGQNETWINSWNTIFANFEAKHPEYKLDITDSGFREVTTKAGAALAAGISFDDIYGYFGWLGPFVDGGIIQPVTPLLAKDTEVTVDDFYESGILKYKGVAYGLAWLLTAHPIWSNNDKFVEAGLKTPAELEAEGNWTWEAVLEAAVRLTKREGDEITFGGLRIYPTHTSYLPYYAWAWGADLWNEGCTQATFNTPEFADAVQFCVDLFAKHRVIGGNFLKGTQGMFERATGGVRQFEEQITANDLFEIGMAGRPKGPNGDSGTVMTPIGIFIGEGAKNPEGGWAFLKYTVSADALPQVAATGQGRFTANKHLEPLTLFPYEDPEVYKRMAAEGRPVPQLLKQGDFNTEWRATWDAMVEGSLTVAEGMAKTQEQVQGWINEGGCLR